MGSSRQEAFGWIRCSLLAILIAQVASTASAQTVRPVVVEHYTKKVRSKFELVNDGLQPLTVVLEPKSFDVTETGEAVYRPLDPRIHLRLSAMSARIPAQQSRVIFYEAEADTAPAWFVITSTFSGMPRRSGLEVEVELPHTVYLVQKEPLRREDVMVHTAVFSPSEKWILVEIENLGPRLGRATQIEAISKSERRQHPSFPLLPHGQRQLVVPWDSPLPPERLTIRFQGFTLDIPLVKASQVAG